MQPKLYTSQCKSLSGEDLSATVDLSQVRAIGATQSHQFPVHMNGLKAPVMLFAKDYNTQPSRDLRSELVDAWTDYVNEASK